MLGKLLRLFGYVFTGVLCFGMAALGAVVLLSASNNFTLEMIPWWTGRELAKWLLGSGVVGLAITAMAVSGRLPILQALWTAVLLGVMVYGFYLTGYKYDGWDPFRSSLNLTAGAFVAFAAAITGLFVKPVRPR